MDYLSHMTPNHAAAHAVVVPSPSYGIDQAIEEIRQKHPQALPKKVYIQWAKDALIALNLM